MCHLPYQFRICKLSIDFQTLEISSLISQERTFTQGICSKILFCNEKIVEVNGLKDFAAEDRGDVIEEVLDNTLLAQTIGLLLGGKMHSGNG